MLDFCQHNRRRLRFHLATLLFIIYVVLVEPQIVTGENNDESLVELNLTGTVSFLRLVAAVSKQMDERFLYSANLANRQVTIYLPAKIPKSALPALLGSLLKGENLAVVDSDVAGWKRIVDFADMVPYATADYVYSSS